MVFLYFYFTCFIFFLFVKLSHQTLFRLYYSCRRNLRYILCGLPMTCSNTSRHLLWRCYDYLHLMILRYFFVYFCPFLILTFFLKTSFQWAVNNFSENYVYWDLTFLRQHNGCRAITANALQHLPGFTFLTLLV